MDYIVVRINGEQYNVRVKEVDSWAPPLNKNQLKSFSDGIIHENDLGDSDDENKSVPSLDSDGVEVVYAEKTPQPQLNDKSKVVKEQSTQAPNEVPSDSKEDDHIQKKGDERE